ncbi:hypothetical protein RIR_jg11348.t1 [Rhizophagus irregularis DAOM 181602=DAOM 197198]|nr:hypothetical protein RIR_jg11348.t1 [Rhizophagus irregularis DAOM 181602=DAOM 197198]
MIYQISLIITIIIQTLTIPIQMSAERAERKKMIIIQTLTIPIQMSAERAERKKMIIVQTLAIQMPAKRAGRKKMKEKNLGGFPINREKIITKIIK